MNNIETKEEKTYERVSDYSLWHRSLGSEFLTVDIDFVEYRNGRGIVGIICTTSRLKNENHLINSKKFIFKRIFLERKIVLDISKKLNVPAYFVIHTDDLSVFHVYNLEDMDSFKIMNKEQYGDFIKNL